MHEKCIENAKIVSLKLSATGGGGGGGGIRSPLPKIAEFLQIPPYKHTPKLFDF